LPEPPKPHDYPVAEPGGSGGGGGGGDGGGATYSDERRGVGGERGFERRVRDDYFAALRGDEAALARVERVCDEVLAREPQHAEALVWKGSVLAVRSGKAYRGLSIRTGQRLWDQSLALMARARELEPGNASIMLARGQCLIHMAGFHLDRRVRRELTALGVQDLTGVMPLIAERFPRWTPSEQGELLTTLAQGHDRLGQTEQARVLYQRVLDELPGTPHAQRAKGWMDTR
jgi:hypothetical protein